MELVKISVLIVTYNQSDVIRRTLDSVLRQARYGLFEVVISDDNSIDNTWDILLEYRTKYPNIIKPYRNEHNLGIYPNMLKVLSLRGNADLFYFLSGDDAINDGWFDAIQQCVNEKKINVKNAISIYSDWQMINPDGKVSFFSNKRVESGLPLMSLKNRGEIFSRSLLSTETVLSQFRELPLDKGITVAEGVFERQFIQYSKQNYYCPFVGEIYYSDIGVSTNMRDTNTRHDRISKWKEYMNLYSFPFKSDYRYINYQIRKEIAFIDPSLNNIILYIISYFRGLDFRFKPFVKRFLSDTLQLIKTKYK